MSSIFFSRDVVFNESLRGIDSQQEETQGSQIEFSESEPEPEGECTTHEVDHTADQAPVVLRRST